MSLSAERACAIPPPVSRILKQPDIGMGTVPLPVLEDVMEVDFDAGVEPVLVRRGTKRASSTRDERADQADVEVSPDTTGECCNRDAVELVCDSWRNQDRANTGARMRDVQTASQVRKVIHADSHQHDNVPQSQERRNPAESCDT